MNALDKIVSSTKKIIQIISYEQEFGVQTLIQFRFKADISYLTKKISRINLGAQLADTVLSCEDREKMVLWCGSGPPCLLCLWLPVNQNTNLTADTSPPISALCLLTYCDNNLSQLFIQFFLDPMRDCGCLVI